MNLEMNKIRAKIDKQQKKSAKEISKRKVYKFWCDHIKPIYGDKLNSCYMDTDSFMMNIRTGHIDKDIENDVEKIFDPLNFQIERPLPTSKNKEIIGLMKDELCGKILTEFVGRRPKKYSYLIDDGSDDEKPRKREST